MGTVRRRRGLGTLALLMVVVAACAAPEREHGDRAVRYDSIGELVARRTPWPSGASLRPAGAGSWTRRMSSSRS